VRIRTVAIWCMIVVGLAAELSWAQYPAPSAAPGGQGSPAPQPFGVDPSVAVVIGSTVVLLVIVAIVALARSGGSNARRGASS
jgi:hypothetical protein